MSSPAVRRLRRAVVAVVVVVGCLATSAAGVGSAGAAAATALEKWLASPLIRIAHRGGSADWPEASPLAYRNAIAWSPDLALEFPARRTSDGVWVASEDASTGRVFGRDLVIADSTWSQLSSLRSIKGNQPMSRLQQNVLDVAPTNRILFVDDKDDAYVNQLLNLLDQYGGSRRTVIKSFYSFVNTPRVAAERGYTTWGFYYAKQMGDFAATQGKFDLLGMQYSAAPSVYDTMLATGKRVIAHVVATTAQANNGLNKGATGLMVSGVEEVVPQG